MKKWGRFYFSKFDFPEAISTWIIHESKLLQTLLRGAKRRGNLMNMANHDEITTLSSIARDDVVVHCEWAATRQMR